MAQVESLAIPSKLFMSPFDLSMMEEEDVKPDTSSWGMSSLSTLIPKFTPSEWFNPSSPAPLASDYFGAPLTSQNLNADVPTPGHPFNSSLTPSFWLFQNPSAGESSASGSTPTSASGNGTGSSLASPFMSSGQTGSELNFQSSAQAGPSSQFSSPRITLFDRPNAIPTSLLVSPPKQISSPLVGSPAIPIIGGMAVDSPEPYEDLSLQRGRERERHKPAVHSIDTKPCGSGRAAKRRGSSYSSLDDQDDMGDNGDEHEHDQYEIHEGVERDGMIWGMKVEDYRALSARERKRVRNRISARTFRAKRKEHLTSLETDLNAKDVKIKVAQDEAAKLRRQVADLKRRLAKYETV